jgi:FAD/FMN-containing dehydrogenase
VPVVSGAELRGEDLAELTRNLPLSRGLGRAYGDAALPAAPDRYVAGTTLANRILSFDSASGELTVEAGISLDEIIRVFLPRGFFTPVTPGTRFVTVGGMVACDVHGKNHHVAGTFGAHVVAIKLCVADGRIVVCSPTELTDLFFATIGGMGLTGHILEVTLRLERVPSPWIYEERQQVGNIDAFLDALKTAASAWPMTMGWIDCLARGRAMGRGVLFKGRWAARNEAPAAFPKARPELPMPIEVPSWFLQPFMIRAFNVVNYSQHALLPSSGIVHPHKFFYPLDAIGNWRRLYGPRGFAQYQCVLPAERAHDAARRFMNLLTDKGGASFLCVIKDCGPEGRGLLSFPRPGISIAIDIPMRDTTQALVDAMNELVIAQGGRIYLAKDALTRAEHFRAMEPRLDRFLAVRRTWDPEGRIRSAQSVRLFGW